ncbi:hypothetical protein HDU84_001336 [Entophlyctis sp. JEL0112]|nr:hypothetical protein HDU84_001336 [Entophlyctis sp. JEL0112]
MTPPLVCESWATVTTPTPTASATSTSSSATSSVMMVSASPVVSAPVAIAQAARDSLSFRCRKRASSPDAATSPKADILAPALKRLRISPRPSVPPASPATAPAAPYTRQTSVPYSTHSARKRPSASPSSASSDDSDADSVLADIDKSLRTMHISRKRLRRHRSPDSRGRSRNDSVDEHVDDESEAGVVVLPRRATGASWTLAEGCIPASHVPRRESWLDAAAAATVGDGQLILWKDKWSNAAKCFISRFGSGHQKRNEMENDSKYQNVEGVYHELVDVTPFGPTITELDELNEDKDHSVLENVPSMAAEEDTMDYSR